MVKKIEVSDETYEKIKSQLASEEIKEVNSLEDLIGQTFCFQCARYIYHGTIKSITSDYIELENASIVFDTGNYDNSKADDMQKLPHNAFVLRQAIESFFKMKW